MHSSYKNSDTLSVLLSTYNGSRFLSEQLISIWQQSYANLKIFVRDDGSTDSTLDVLKIEQSQGKLTLLPIERNLGPADSFFKLLESGSSESGYFAFCDQDDIWHPNKMEAAVKAIQQFSTETPVLYFSRVTYVDAENQFIKLSPLPRAVGFGNALVENIAIGCTVVMNKAARDLIVKRLPKKCLMHDSWCYLLVSCLGEVIYDPVPSMRYRQHASNTIGASTSILQTLNRRVKRFSIRKHGVFRFNNQAEQFLELYGDTIPTHHRQAIVQFVEAKRSLAKRLILAFSPLIWRQNIFDNLILRLLIIINRY